jgi:hypothetical protein
VLIQCGFLSLPSAPQLSWDVLANGSTLCDKTAVLGAAIKETPCKVAGNSKMKDLEHTFEHALKRDYMKVLLHVLSAPYWRHSCASVKCRISDKRSC